MARISGRKAATPGQGRCHPDDLDEAGVVGSPDEVDDDVAAVLEAGRYGLSGVFVDRLNDAGAPAAGRAT